MVNTGPARASRRPPSASPMRALGHGWARRRRAVHQGPGDRRAGRAAIVRRTRGLGIPPARGFTWETQDKARDIAACQRAWVDRIGPDGRSERRLIVLDELNIALRYDYLPLDDVVAQLTARRSDLHVVVTGRNAKPALIEAADLVTEMGAVKHHFSAGVKTQAGIEF